MKCARCNTAKAKNRWELRACADGRRKRSRYLCDEHDAELNEVAMRFLGITDAGNKAERYRALLAAAPRHEPGEG